MTKNTKIPSLIGQNSWFLFETLGLNTEWLKTPVQTWVENRDYLSNELLNLKF